MKKAYKRSIFVINPKFQYKFSIFICSIVFLSCLIYPLTIYDVYDQIISLQPSLSGKLEESRSMLLIILAAIQFSILGIIFVLSIFMSHKIAGPMYKMTNYLKNIQKGEKVEVLTFRNGDNFQEVAEQLNSTLNYLVDQRDADFATLEEIASYISNLSLVLPEDKKPVLEEILSKLAQIQNRY